MSDLISLIENTNPVVAAALILLGISVAMLRRGADNRLDSLESRLGDIERLDLDSRLASIQTDLVWIKAALTRLTGRGEGG